MFGELKKDPIFSVKIDFIFEVFSEYISNQDAFNELNLSEEMKENLILLKKILYDLTLIKTEKDPKEEMTMRLGKLKGMILQTGKISCNDLHFNFKESKDELADLKPNFDD